MQDLAIITLSWSLLVEMRNDKMMLMTKQGLVTHQVGEANFGHLNICLAGSGQRLAGPLLLGRKFEPGLAQPGSAGCLYVGQVSIQ